MKSGYNCPLSTEEDANSAPGEGSAEPARLLPLFPGALPAALELLLRAENYAQELKTTAAAWAAPFSLRGKLILDPHEALIFKCMGTITVLLTGFSLKA